MRYLTTQQALELIEMMVFELDEKDDKEKLLKITGEIYQVAHSHNKNHSCYYVHKKGWRKQAAEMFPKLKKVIGS